MFRNFDTSQKRFLKNNGQSATKFIQLDWCLPMLAYVKQFGVWIPPEFKDTFQLVSLFELQKLHKRC